MKLKNKTKQNKIEKKISIIKQAYFINMQKQAYFINSNIEG